MFLFKIFLFLIALFQSRHLMANNQKPAELNGIITPESPYGQAKLSKILFWGYL